jgi:hypothetical protein
MNVKTDKIEKPLKGVAVALAGFNDFNGFNAAHG